MSLDSIEFSLDQNVDRDVGVLQEFHETNLSLVSNWHIVDSVHFDSSLTVVENTSLDFVERNIVQVTVEEGVLTSIFDRSRFAVELSDLHLGRSYTSSLAAEKVVDLTKLFRSVQLSNENLVLVHLLNTECQGDTNCQGKTFRDGNNDEDNYQVDVLWNFLHDDIEGLLITLLIGCSDLDEHADEENDEYSD